MKFLALVFVLALYAANVHAQVCTQFTSNLCLQDSGILACFSGGSQSICDCKQQWGACWSSNCDCSAESQQAFIDACNTQECSDCANINSFTSCEGATFDDDSEVNLDDLISADDASTPCAVCFSEDASCRLANPTPDGQCNCLRTLKSCLEATVNDGCLETGYDDSWNDACEQQVGPTCEFNCILFSDDDGPVATDDGDDEPAGDDGDDEPAGDDGDDEPQAGGDDEQAGGDDEPQQTDAPVVQTEAPVRAPFGDGGSDDTPISGNPPPLDIDFDDPNDFGDDEEEDDENADDANADDANADDEEEEEDDEEEEEVSDDPDNPIVVDPQTTEVEFKLKVKSKKRACQPGAPCSEEEQFQNSVADIADVPANAVEINSYSNDGSEINADMDFAETNGRSSNSIAKFFRNQISNNSPKTQEHGFSGAKVKVMKSAANALAPAFVAVAAVAIAIFAF